MFIHNACHKVNNVNNVNKRYNFFSFNSDTQASDFIESIIS